MSVCKAVVPDAAAGAVRLADWLGMMWESKAAVPDAAAGALAVDTAALDKACSAGRG